MGNMPTAVAMIVLVLLCGCNKNKSDVSASPAGATAIQGQNAPSSDPCARINYPKTLKQCIPANCPTDPFNTVPQYNVAIEIIGMVDGKCSVKHRGMPRNVDCLFSMETLQEIYPTYKTPPDEKVTAAYLKRFNEIIARDCKKVEQ